MKRLLLLLCLLAGIHSIQAAGFPELSSGTQERWYYLKFTQGSFVVGSNGEGGVCKAVIPTTKDSQLWKVEGSETDGYTFTNKLGLRLYVSGTGEGAEVRAAASSASNDRFRINTRYENYTITPYSNIGQAFNAWGGMGLRNDIKLYRSTDANAPMAFIAEEDMVVKDTDVDVVPYPASLTIGEGVYDLHQLKGIEVPAASIAVPTGLPKDDTAPLLLLANSLKGDLFRTAGIDVNIKTDETAEWVGAAFIVDEGLGEEAYRLTITPEGIMLKAADYGGFFNGLQTLRQLMPAAIYGQEAAPEATWTVPCLDISDAPAMHHRGFHLDVSRHFFDKDEVKKLLDMASVYKLNRFHWHLSDDQGWRVEIPEYPKLTTVGAIRKASLSVADPSGDKFFDDTEYGRGCFYTLDDLREIVAYAAERNIQIIPEIDMPGHMTACIVAYPELGCNPEKKIEVMTEGGISRDILNLGKTETIDFLKCVLGHLAEVFPYELMHIGGDECPTSAWESNADCQRLITSEQLGNVKGIQPWLVEVLGKFLRENYGKNVVVWDELLANWNSNYTTHPVVMSWRGVDYAKQAADKGFYSIMVPTSPLYFDYPQMNSDQLEIDCPYNTPYTTVNTVEKVYNFDPRSTVKGKEQYVLGTQANLWTESCTSNREAEYQYYPRLLAVSEIAWLPTEKKNFVGFYKRLQGQEAVLQAKNICYAPHYFEPADLTPTEQAIAEAKEILAQSNPGAVGYPQVSEAEALQQTLNALVASPKDDTRADALRQQIATYKNAPIVKPTADALYKIESASTYFRKRFNGSSLYVKEDGLALHYTPQTDLEELWKFVPLEDGTYQMVSLLTGKALTIPTSTSEKAQVSSQQGSAITIRKATKPAGDITYVPGVVNIKNGRMNLYAKLSGIELTLTASLDSSLCYPATWRILEINDYRHWLQKLVEKAEYTLLKTLEQEGGLISETALQFLSDDVIAEGHERLEQATVSQQDYLDIADRFAQYQEMRSNLIELLDLSHYYLIHNLANDTYYATANTNADGVVPKVLTDEDSFRWFFVKKGDGTVYIYNKQTGTAAYVKSNADGKRICLGQEYPWRLSEATLDNGSKGVTFIDETGAFGWHATPKSWNYVLLKPYTQNASVWELIKTDEEVGTGIYSLTPTLTHRNDGIIYDLSGRQMPHGRLPRGIYIRNGKKVVR